MEGSGAKDENRGVDKKGEAERNGRVENGVTHGFAAVAGGGAKGPRLHNAGVKVKIVRHHRGAQDADGNVKHFAIPENFRAGDEADGGFAPEWVRKKDFVSEANGDGGDERNDEGFHEAEAAALQGENEQNVESGDENAGEKRHAKEQLQSDGGAKNFRKVTCGDGDFANHPKEQGGAAGVVLAAGLREIAAGRDAKLCGQSLQEHRHQIADQDDAKKRVAEF